MVTNMNPEKLFKKDLEPEEIIALYGDIDDALIEMSEEAGIDLTGYIDPMED